jgi:hypothetical protein
MENRHAAWSKFLTPSNIILMITLVVGLIAIPVRTFGQGTSIVEQAVLAVVTLLAGAQLASSYSAIKQEEKWETHHKTQQEIAEVIKNFPSGHLKRRNDILPLEEFAGSAKGIFIIARTASKVAGRFKFFRKQLEHGCRLRFVVANPEAFRQNDIEAVTPTPLTGAQALKIFTAELDVTLQNIQHVQKLSEDTPGKVEIRLVNYISNMSFVAVDEGDGRGRIIMELMPYKCQELDRPHIELSSHDPNTYWYELGMATCEEIWEHATPMTA